MFYFKMLNFMLWGPFILGFFSIIVSCKYAKYIVKFSALITLLISVILYYRFFLQSDFFWSQQYTLFPKLGLNYSLELNSLVVCWLLLSSIISFALVYSSSNITSLSSSMPTVVLLMHGLLNGVIIASNAAMLYIFSEIIVIFLSVLLFHTLGSNLHNSNMSIKFLWRNLLAGSLLFFVLIYLRNISIQQNVASDQLLEFRTLYQLSLSFKQQTILFLTCILAIAIKLPLLPWHNCFLTSYSCLPKNVQVFAIVANLQIIIIVLYRLVLPVLPVASIYFSEYVIMAGLIGVIYIGMVLLRQVDVDKAIIHIAMIQAHLVVVAIFVAIGTRNHFPQLAISGLNIAMVLLWSFSLVVTGLYLCVGYLLEHINSIKHPESFVEIPPLPLLLYLSIFLVVVNIGIPGTPNFIAEFFTAIASFKLSNNLGMLVIASIATTFIYILKLQRVLSTKFVLYDKKNYRWVALICNPQAIILFFLVSMILTLGVYPKSLTKIIQPNIYQLITKMEQVCLEQK